MLSPLARFFRDELSAQDKKLRGLIQHVAMHEASIALIRSTTMRKEKQDTLVIPRINAILVAKQEIEALMQGTSNHAH